jgi:hypothetical protein
VVRCRHTKLYRNLVCAGLVTDMHGKTKIKCYVAIRDRSCGRRRSAITCFVPAHWYSPPCIFECEACPSWAVVVQLERDALANCVLAVLDTGQSERGARQAWGVYRNG